SVRLDQLLLDRTGFQDLFTLRSLIRDDKTTTDDEWLPALDALFKAQLRRQYGPWHREESAANITLSPQFFVLPPAQLLRFPPQPNPDDEPTSSLFTKADLQKWRGILRARIDEETAVTQAQADMIDRVEQGVLGGLRDSLVFIYAQAAGFTA